MADVFSNSLRVREQESGSNAGTWGGLLNTTIRNIASAFGQGSETIPNASTHTITLADGVADEARSMYLKCTGGGQACTVTLAPNTVSKVWIIDNATSYTLTFSQGSGANVAIAAGAVKVIATDGAGSGAAVVDTLDGLEGSLSTLAVTGAATMDRLGLGVAAHASAALLIDTTDQHIRLANGSELGVIELDSDGELNIWAHGDGETINLKTGSGAGTDVLSVVGSNVGIGTSSPSFPLTVQADSNADGLVIIGRSSDDIGELGFYENDGSTNLGEIQYRQDHVNFRHRVGGIRFATGGTTERMRITSAGNVGIGTTSPQAAKFSGTAVGILELANTKPVINIHETDVTDAEFFMGMSGGSAVIGTSGNGLMIFQTGTSSTSERMRIDSSGNLLVGTSNSSQSVGDGVKTKDYGAVQVVNDSSTGGGDAFSYYSSSGGNYRFWVNANGQIAAVFTSITSLSDQRLKENIRDLDDGLSKVMQLQPRKFDWKEGKGKNTANDRGFIAQEFEQVFPDLVGEWKDEAPEGEEPYKAVSADLIPTLVKAIQEQQATITALEARITQLENN